MFNISKQLIWIFALFAFLSCDQDPLKNIPENLKKNSVYQTGPDRKSILDSNFLSSGALRVTFNGKKDLILPFQEGEESGYIIKVGTLYKEFPFAIDVKTLDHSLEGFKWRYYKKKKELAIVWKPADQFAQYQSSREIVVPFYIELRDLKNLDKPPLIVDKELILKIAKTYEQPEIVKIEYDSIFYEKLEDKKFYEVPKNGKINLRLDRKIYEKFTDSDTFSPPIVYDVNYNFEKPLYDTKLLLGYYRSETKPITQDIYTRLNKNIYKRKVGEENCSSSDELQNENGKTVCYVKLKDERNSEIDLDSKIYEAYYVFPEVLVYDDNGEKKKIIFDSKMKTVYRKTKVNQEGNACKIQSSGGHKGGMIRSRKSRHDFRRYAGEEEYKYCYIQILSKDTFITKTVENSYYLPDINKKENLYPLLKGQLQRKFRLMPKAVKLSIAGYRSKVGYRSKALTNDSFHFIFNSRSASELRVYVKDFNYIEQGPLLLLSKTGDLFSPIKISLNGKFNLEDSIWVFVYRIEDKKFTDNTYQRTFSKPYLAPYVLNNFHFLPFKLTPQSGETDTMLSGLPIPIGINSYPDIQVFYEEQPEDSQSVKASQDIIEERSGETIVRKISNTALNLSHDVKVKYLFPNNSFKTFLKMTPIKKDLTHFDLEINLQNLFDILTFDLKPYAPEVPSSSLGCVKAEFPQENGDYKKIFNPTCSCQANDQPKNEDGKVVLEQDCNFNVKINIDSKLNKPFYAHYSYGFGKSLASLRDDVFDTRNNELKLSHYTVTNPNSNSVDKKFKTIHSSFSGIDMSSRFFFFNLKPSINCLNVAESKNKECIISYNHQNITRQIDLLDEGYEIDKDSFSIDTICKNAAGEEKPCPCDKEVRTDSNDSRTSDGIFKKCLFVADEHGYISTSLRTHRDDIFLINTLEEFTSDTDMFKKTKTQTLSY